VRFDLFQQVLIKMAARLWAGLLQKLVLPGSGYTAFNNMEQHKSY
jgi:cephalosporin-C deacetylase-like acetyl esterase